MIQRVRIHKILVDGNWLNDQVVHIKAGIIVAMARYTEGQAIDVTIDAPVIPGYVDTQVNGGGGVMFNHAPTYESLQIMAEGHRQFGTTSMLPTLITDDIDTISKAADAIAEAIEKQHPGIVGVHFEGPHLSVAKKGIHVASHIRALSDEEFAIYTRKDLGKVMVTVAPENVSVETISALCAEGVTVSLGHSNASGDVVANALAAGATGFTHLMNAMSPFTSREPGMVGEALLSDAYCGLIVDHQHLHPHSAALAIKAKGAERIMLVTDAMAHVGGNEDTISFFDTKITRAEGKLTTPDGTIAGSCLDMHTAVLNCVNDLAVPLAKASEMASKTPAAFIGLTDRIGRIAVGCKADFLVLDENNAITQIWQNGHCVTQ